MKKFISRLSIALAALLSATLLIPIAACSGGKIPIKVVSMGGISLPEVQVTVKKDGKDYATGVTNKNGEWSVRFKSGTYTAEITGGLPVGYSAEESYKLDTSKEVITLGVTSSVITDEQIPANKKYLVGDVMYDFTLERAFSYAVNNGRTPQEIKLSDVLKEKKAVLLNFFYTTCYWCNEEYPSMRDAYNEYSDDLEILAIDNYGTDTETLVINEVINKKVPFYMAMDNAGVVSHFDMRGYPTSVMIDRYGVVCELSETILDVDVWRNWFKKYTAEDYSQDINIGNNVEDETTFIPDSPEDFNAEMPASSAINDRINKTGVSVSFTEEDTQIDNEGNVRKSAWPWNFADDGQSIAPTNTGHRGTTAIIYASLNLPENTVLAFDYKVSMDESEDRFYVAVDGRGGIGKQTVLDFGNKDWQKGIAYVSLEAGTHEIAFIYYRGSVNGKYDDNVYVKNLRFEPLSSLDNVEGFDMPYFAARLNNYQTGGFDVYSSVYLNTEDGFYHVGDENAKKATDPVLLADMYSATPYFSNPKESLFNKYISTDNCTFGNTNYYNLMKSYAVYSSNSDIKGLVPVTPELQKALNALYNNENTPGQLHYSNKGWLEFCVFYMHYGKGEGYGNIIEGLAYFTAIEAHETTNEPNTGNLNEVTFDRIYMPRGLLYKFVPSESGVYKFGGVSKEGTDAWLFDDSLKYAPSIQDEIKSSGFDDYVRDDIDYVYDPDDVLAYDFQIYHYLEQGKTYYVMPAFHVVEEIGSFKFRIDYVGEEHYLLTSATAGYYTLDENGKITLQVYATPEWRDIGDEKVLYDSKSARPIYCDFTSASRMFTPYSLEKLLSGSIANAKNYFNLTGTSITIDDTVYEGKDYTATMKEYLAKAKDKDKKDELYGMVEVDWELQIILKLLYTKYIGVDDEFEWLKACWFYEHISA